MTVDNSPAIWRDALPRLKSDGSKYDRGHALVIGGPIQATGAARLSARAALRIGAGLVSVVCDETSLPVYAVALQAVMTKMIKDPAAFSHLLEDKRITAALIGPGAGLSNRTSDFALAALAAGPCVLDADALTVFRKVPAALFRATSANTLMTPHEGEFTRLFGAISERVADTQKAAKASGAVVLLKGRDTVIAAPDGRTVINRDAPPQLATAGSGDVLAGMAVGLMAQGMAAFDAACAAAWLHAQAARRFGEGLIAEDLEGELPAVIAALR